MCFSAADCLSGLAFRGAKPRPGLFPYTQLGTKSPRPSVPKSPKSGYARPTGPVHAGHSPPQFGNMSQRSQYLLIGPVLGSHRHAWGTYNFLGSRSDFAVASPQNRFHTLNAVHTMSPEINVL